MSRKQLNDRYCVRCGRSGATPYLRDNLKLFKEDGWKDKIIADIGCGNGRNSKYMCSEGFKNIHSFDMVNDFGTKLVLGVDDIPLEDESVDIILANYILMFLSPEERSNVVREIKRIAKKNAVLMIELYGAKDSYAKNKQEVIAMQEELFDAIGWKKMRYSKERFIVRNT